MNIPSVSEKTPTKHILDSIANLDTVYEAWIFLAFIDYLYEKGFGWYDDNFGEIGDICVTETKQVGTYTAERMVQH